MKSNNDATIYEYLGRHHDIVPEDELWVICGDYTDGEGILAWCFNEDDAKLGASAFNTSSRFTGIHYHKYKG
jgi:hypothetical protein